MEIESEKQGSRREYEIWNDYETHVIGAATVDESGESPSIETINIQRNRRDRGIGSELLEEIVSDYQDMELEAWVFSARLEWYERHGFEKEGKKEELIKVRKPSGKDLADEN